MEEFLGAARGAVRGAVGLGDWVRNLTAESRETLQDVYHEARAEVQAERAQASSPGTEAGART